MKYSQFCQLTTDHTNDWSILSLRASGSVFKIWYCFIYGTKIYRNPKITLLRYWHIFLKFFIIIIFLLYSIVLVLPYINMHPPRVYTCSPSSTPLPLPSPYHPSGSSQCTSPKLPVSCIEPGLAIRFLYGLCGRGRGGMIWENGIKTCIIW